MFAPQSRRIEVWDVERHAIVLTFDPHVPAMTSLSFDRDGQRFAAIGGARPTEQKLVIFDVESLTQIDEALIGDQGTNPVFAEDGTVVFGTWSGALCAHDLRTRSVRVIEEVPGAMLGTCCVDRETHDVFVSVQPTTREGENFPDPGYLLARSAAAETRRLAVPTVRGERIASVAAGHGHVACLILGAVIRDGGRAAQSARLVISREGEAVFEKRGFAVTADPIDRHTSVAFSRTGSVAFVGLDEVFVIDPAAAFSERSFPCEAPTSVAFCEVLPVLAVGGDDAQIFRL